MRAHLAEFIGTFALVFFGCGAIAASELDAAGVALAFGLVIAVMIYALGRVSGAHFNPAVSVGFALARHFPWPRVATFVLAQVAGATSGALLLRLALPAAPSLGVTAPAVGVGQALLWEVILTFVLMLVITAVATDTRAIGWSPAMAIGGAVALGALVAGPLTGGSMNPARSVGPAIVSGELGALWIYLVAPVLGASLGAVTYGYLRGPRGEAWGAPTEAMTEVVATGARTNS